MIGARGRPGGLSDEFTGFLLDENRLYEYKSPLVPMRVEGGFLGDRERGSGRSGSDVHGSNPRRGGAGRVRGRPLLFGSDHRGEAGVKGAPRFALMHSPSEKYHSANFALTAFREVRIVSVLCR